MTAEVHGTADAGWGGVADAFARNFAAEGDIGANVAVYVDGRPVVDLWGGRADVSTGREWDATTVANIFSCSKGLMATVVHQLVEEGLLDVEGPVAASWPEFAAAGKGEITVRQLLSHQAGLAAIAGDFTLEQALAWTPVVDALAAQPTDWEPGTKHGYHMRSFGWLVGELVRRITGDAPGVAFRRRIVEPLGLSAWIGMPRSEQDRCARLVPPDTEIDMASLFGPDSLQARVFTGPSGLFHYDEMWNRPEIRAAVIPSSGGIADARSLARLYAACIGEVDGVRLLGARTVAVASELQAQGTDAVLTVPTSFALGYMVGPSLPPACGPAAFGHGGAGGSASFADPEAGVGFGYVMNRMRLDPDDPRAADLVAAVYAALG